MLTIVSTDLNNPTHQRALIELLSQYALDEMGGGEALPDSCLENLITALQTRRDYYSWLAFKQEKAVGLLNSFESFSTFYAKPLLNIHDLTVVPDYRNQGIAKSLMQQATDFAKQKGYCKLTLEVLAENKLAKTLYHKLGYVPYKLSDSAGAAEFWQKPL
ncbi:GNAT family N-acetyltransferase [Catenovulum maritimum]|uniref:GNAT family acetyltransferase n=1 Tax=Catenovulum maritimum TaxID=1513271 RepID=A0A0J8GLV2_9ALTE|nr:GNAT family N-acetyltransferase [Catenovulum maritimum]KMT63775.1 GNAT family acetyltransferase [Catenovulum maritimum]